MIEIIRRWLKILGWSKALCVECGRKFKPFACKEHEKITTEICQACHDIIEWKYRKLKSFYELEG